MGPFEAYAAATGPIYGNFDLARASVDKVAEQLQELLEECEQEHQVELHVPTLARPDIEPHLYDPCEDIKDRIAECASILETIEHARERLMGVIAGEM